MTTPARTEASPQAVDAVLLTALVIGSLALYHALGSRFVLDCDVTNLALGIERFDVREHQPHPPGYLGYVLLLRLVHRLTRLDLVAVAELVSALVAAATPLLAWAAARRFVPEDRAAARWTAFLTATNPILLYYGVDGQTHAAEAAMAAALLWSLPADRARATLRDAVLIGLVIAAGGSLRPSFALVAVGPALWALGLDVPRLAVCGAVALAGTLAWMLPTVLLSGGWHAYRASSDALIGGFADMISPLSDKRDPRMSALNLRDTVMWTLLAVGPALVALAARRAARVPPSGALGRALVLLAATGVPAIAFFVLVFCAEAGYLAGLVPVAALVAALATGGARPLRALAGGLVVAQLAFFFFGPERIARSFMMPTLAEITDRQFLSETLFNRITEGTVPEARILVISDHPSPTILRQFPLVRPPLDVLFVHSKKRFALGMRDAISLATAHFWHAVPGPLNMGGEERTLHAAHDYDVVVIDPRSSDDVWRQLAAQSSCPLPPLDDEMHAPHLPRRCFGSAIELTDERYRFELPPH
jgi:hypothetical protein